MDQIAERAAVAKGTLYNYFESKDDLYVSILQQGLDGVLAEIKEESPADGRPAEETLLTIIERLYSFFMEKRSFFMMLEKEEGRIFNRSDDCYDKICTMKELVAEMVSRGIEQGEFRSVDPAFAARMLLSMVKTAVRDVAERPFRASEIVDLFVNGIERRDN